MEKKDFAIIEVAGKQYTVSVGDTITTESFDGAEEGKEVAFDKVLMTSTGDKVEVGTPYVSGKKVSGTVDFAGRGKKISVLRFRPKSRYHRKRGHRQEEVKVTITSL